MLGRAMLMAATAAWSSYDADAQTYITAVETADGQALETAVKDAINAFVVGCKSDGIWAAIKASCILAGARTLTGALVPLVGSAPTNVNFVTADYNRKTGLVGNGSSKYLDSNRAGNAQAQNSIHCAVYVSTAATSNAATYPLYIANGNNATGSTNIGRLNNNGGFFVRNRNSENNSPSASGASTGFIAMNRSTSSSFTFRANSGDQTFSTTSQASASGTFTLYNQGLASDLYSNGRMSFYSIGDSLTLSLLDSRVTTLINALAAAIP